VSTSRCDLLSNTLHPLFFPHVLASQERNIFFATTSVPIHLYFLVLDVSRNQLHHVGRAPLWLPAPLPSGGNGPCITPSLRKAGCNCGRKCDSFSLLHGLTFLSPSRARPLHFASPRLAQAFFPSQASSSPPSFRVNRRDLILADDVRRTPEYALFFSF